MVNNSVLLVEDDAIIREILVEFFADEGIGIVEAKDGREALDILANGYRPFVILLDLMMPVLDGRGFLLALHSRPPNTPAIPVVLMTASADIPSHVLDEVNVVLPKPFNLNQLQQVVSSYYKSS